MNFISCLTFKIYLINQHLTGLTLHDFCRVTDQIGYDMKQWIIAENHGIGLKSGPLRSTLSHYPTNYPRLCFPGVNFEQACNVTTACDSLRYIES